MTSQLGSDKALAGDTAGMTDMDIVSKYSVVIQDNVTEEAQILHTAGASQLSTVLKQAGHTAPTACFSPTSLRRCTLESRQGT